MPGLSCDMWGLLITGMRALRCGTWDLVPGIEPEPLHWKCGVLATGPPGRSACLIFNVHSLIPLSPFTFKQEA